MIDKPTIDGFPSWLAPAEIPPSRYILPASGRRYKKGACIGGEV